MIADQKVADSGPVSAAKTAFDPALGAIRLRFIETITPRLLQFENLKQTYMAQPDHLQALTAMGDLAHKITGVADTLGFSEIGQCSTIVDRQISRGIADNNSASAIWDRAKDSLERLLDAMEAALDA